MMCFGLKDRKRLKTNHCVIVLLDDTQLVHELHPTSTGQDLLDVVIKHLNLLETSYFGLKYYHHQRQEDVAGSSNRQQQQQAVWLDVDKSAIKQLRDVNPMTVHFGVKYYASDPCKLAEEITRYQFFLQCKQDILQARLPVAFELAIELFGLAIQSELGDYDPVRHQDNYASEFQFVANQSHELEQRAALFHRQLTGQVPATAELNFLEKIKWLDLYGCQLHRIQYDDGDLGDQYALGLNPSGVLVLRNRLKVAQYYWARIVKTKCQGRCFLMDVIDTASEQQQSGAGQLTGGLLLTTANGTLAREGNKSTGVNGNKRNRFGFRLADKDAARRLRWAIEEHKHFYHLIHSSSSPNQLARAQRQQQQAAMVAAAAAAMAAAEQQQQQMKFSQRFRNSIRSAIHLGAPTTSGGNSASSFHLHHSQQAQLAFAHQQQQQQKLRSSVKSLSQMQRPQPTVVRTPSRRYSNRSLPRPNNASSQQQQQHSYRLAANGNGLPPVVGAAHTMAPDQRQQAMLMMQQYSQTPFMMQQQQQQQPVDQYYQPTNYHHLKSKSHTLKPISSKEAKARGQANPYYHQMMMMMAAAAAAQQQQQQHQKTSGLPEVSILPPGQHIVQPSIYKATSVVDGINQLADVQKLQQQQQQQQYGAATMMQQFFNTRPQCAPSNGRDAHQRGNSGAESPRSTKSAMAPSSALKLASRKLAKQQQQFLYGTRRGADTNDTRPLLAYAPDLDHAHHHNSHQQQYARNNISNSGEYSAGASPRSARSARSLATNPTKYRSKSTGENLHLAHLPNGAGFAGGNKSMLLATAPPPPQHHLLPPPDYNSSSTTPISTPSKAGRPAKVASEQRRRDIARARQQQQRRHSDDDDDEDYYCSRSDCSSLEERLASRQSLGGKARQARFINGHLVDTSGAHHKQQSVKEQQEWLAIRQRHSEFSSGKGPLGQLEVPANKSHAIDSNNNSNSDQLQPTSKNITNKQATPILLTMTAQTATGAGGANSKAVQLLNMQRQQLNHQTTHSGPSQADNSQRALNQTSGSDSTTTPNSSVASSPKADQTQTGGGGSKPRFRLHHNAADSTASNSTTTSGYYAGSNSTGPASVDSDTVSADTPTHSNKPAHRGAAWTPNANLYNGQQQQQQQREGGTRAKIALGVHGPNVRGIKPTQVSQPPPPPPQARRHQEPQQQQQYYLGESTQQASVGNDEENEHSLKSLSQHQQQQWNQLEQIQQNHAPSSLKYVSFDV